MIRCLTNYCPDLISLAQESYCLFLVIYMKCNFIARASLVAER